ncbi:MAG: Panacea domain-containing protein [Candidatus Thermoplasmatota archaeon]|jgi:uncharacterized phage-associated protein|nr:Panacea domain-containing protein [Candidatus Thermoplasmatota archaeon]
MISGIELVQYILLKYGPLPQKKLHKLAYLSEIQYIKKHGKRLSDLTFKKYYYGPYSEDIRNIEDLDENIVITEKMNGLYPVKLSEIVNEEVVEPINDPNLRQEIDSLLRSYKDKSGGELEVEADKTEPFLEAENLNDILDLDGYAWYYNKINSDEFWEDAIKKDKNNRDNNVYGKRILKKATEIDSLFS